MKYTHPSPFSKSKFKLKSDHVNLVAQASPIECLPMLTHCPGDTVQTGTGKVDPARKFKCTTAAHEYEHEDIYIITFSQTKVKDYRFQSLNRMSL